MLGRIVKYFETRKAVYQEINKVLDEIIKDDERIHNSCFMAYSEDGMEVYIGNQTNLYKQLNNFIVIYADEAFEEELALFESKLYHTDENGIKTYTELGQKLDELFTYLREDTRPTRLSIESNLKEIGNEYELSDHADSLSLDINLGKDKTITNHIGDIEINFKYNKDTTDSEIARSLMKIFLGKTRS